MNQEFKNCSFQYFFLIEIFRLIVEGNSSNFVGLLLKAIKRKLCLRFYYLGPSFYFMKCRKLSFKKMTKSSPFFDIK